MTKGDIYTIAGNGSAGTRATAGPRPRPSYMPPYSVAVDASGNVLIADTDNYRLRVVAAAPAPLYGQPMTKGDIYTVAGNGTSSNTPATVAPPPRPSSAARLARRSTPRATSVDRRQRRLSDPGSGCRTTGAFYGQAMTKGDIYTIAGMARPTRVMRS